MNQTIIRLSILLLVLTPISIVQAQIQKGELFNEQIDKIFAPWDNKDAPGIAVAIVKDGLITYKKGYGMANLEYNIPIESSTVFDIASLSKQFTGFAISTLIEQGEILLDDDIRMYIPELPDFGYAVTIDHLIHHTSGLRDWPGTLSIKGQVFEDVISFDEILSMAYSQKELNFTPGSEYLYSNTGYNVLAELIQRVTGYSFRQWTETNIFQPLKMTNTHFHDDHTEIIKNKANGYFYKEGNYHVSSNNLTAIGSSSLYTTIDDFVKWAINFNYPKVGGVTIINRMLQQGTLNNDEEISYAFGLDIGKYHGINKISHTGSWASFQTYSGYFPNENISVIIFSNSASFDPEVMGNKIIDIYLPKRIKVESKNFETKDESAVEAITVDENILTTYLGDFESQSGSILKIIKENGQLSAQPTGYSAFKLVPLSITEFTAKSIEAKIEFIPNKGKNIKLIKIHQGGRITESQRVKEFDKTYNLFDFSGDFYSEELSTTYNFTVVNGDLVAKHSRLNDFKLSPLKKDMFTGEAWFFGQIKFIRDSNDIITGCKVSNDRVRNLFFEKVN